MSCERVTAQRDGLLDAILSLERDLPDIDPQLWSWRITRLLVEARRIVGQKRAAGAPITDAPPRGHSGGRPE